VKGRLGRDGAAALFGRPLLRSRFLTQRALVEIRGAAQTAGIQDAIGAIGAQLKEMALAPRPFAQTVVRRARLLKLQRKLAKRLDDRAAAAVENGLTIAVIAVVIIVGVTTAVAIKVSFIFEDLARNVTQLNMH
jgi:Flp pilus assembly pilin Flp